MTLSPTAREPRQLSFTRGPFGNALRRLHLARADDAPRPWHLVAIAWGPLVVGALLRILIGQRPEPLLFDLSVHARLVIAIPLMCLGERMFSERCRIAVDQLYGGQFTDARSLDPLIDRAVRLRDSRVATLILASSAVAVSQATLWGFAGPAGFVSGQSTVGALSFARLWYAFVAQPLVLFMVLRLLWLWLIWSYVAVRVARMKLATIALHPDHAGGIEFMAGPIVTLTPFVAALATLVAASWATRILEAGATLPSFIPSFVIFVVVAVSVACGPYLTYVPMLYRERLRSLRAFNELALHYTRDFQAKWTEVEPPHWRNPLLGTADIQSLNDLLGSYEELARVRLVPFGRRSLIALWAAAVIPMLPLSLTAIPAEELLDRAGKLLLGIVA